MKIPVIVACGALLVVTGCSSTNGTGGAGGSGQGGASSTGTGGARGTGTGGATATGTGGTTATGTGGTTGTGGATGTGGSTPADGGADVRVDASVDAVAVSDAAVATNGSYVRTGWTAAYTCTGTCLVGNGDSPQDTPALALDTNANFTTRWSTNRFQQDFWNANPRQFPLYFTVDMKQVVNVSRVTMHPSCRDIFDAAGQLDVLVSLDGTTFTAVVTAHRPAVPPNGEACPPNANAVATDSITFTRTPARFIQIKATQSLVTAHPGSGDRYWAIGDFNAYP